MKIDYNSGGILDDMRGRGDPILSVGKVPDTVSPAPRDRDIPGPGRAAAARRAKATLARALREPLVHFLIAGFALFAGYGALQPERLGQDETRRIVLTADDIRRLETGWIARWQRPPQPAELQTLVESEVREEILYREALALGLDRGDTIVKRRLAQKMEFLAEDVAAIRDPGAAELRAWFEGHRERFALPPRASFRHVFFSFDRRQGHTEDDARRAHRMLVSARPAPVAATTTGDPFMFQSHYAERTPEQVANVFGSKFAAALFQIEPGSWRGPVESGYGWHLVWIDSIVPGRVPALEEIEPEVKIEWIAEQRTAAKRRAFDAMRARYITELPALR